MNQRDELAEKYYYTTYARLCAKRKRIIDQLIKSENNKKK